MNTFFVTVWLREILQWIYGLVHNYGIAVIIFTVLIRTVLTPFEVKSRKGMRKMSEIQPCLLYTSPSPRDLSTSRMPSSA